MRPVETVRIGNDPSDMTGRVLALPAQMREAWRLAAGGPPLVPRTAPLRCWVVGMGGSAIGGEFVRAMAESAGRIPVDVVRGYEMPASAGPDGLAFFVSYSGNTEETLSAWDEAARKGVPRAAVTSGGALAERARADRVPLLEIPGGSPPRAALGWTCVPVMHALGTAGLLPVDGVALEEAARAAEHALERFGPNGKDSRTAAAWAERAAHGWPVIYAAERPHGATARRWTGQMNENGKTLAHAALLPEQNHNEIVPWERDSGATRVAEVAILDDPAVHVRVRRRLDLVAEACARAGRPAVRFPAGGTGLLARLFSLAALGDLTSLYVAAAAGEDPTPVPAIDRLKAELA